MNNHKSGPLNPLYQQPTKEDLAMLSFLEIPIKTGRNRFYYYPKVKAVIKARLYRAEKLKTMNWQSKLDEVTIAEARERLFGHDVKPSWENLIAVVEKVVHSIAYMVRKTQPPKPPEPTRVEVTTAIEGFLEKRSIIFKDYQRYADGLFHDAQDRVLIEHLFMLRAHYLKKFGKHEFYHSLDAIATETGVKLHSIRRFLDKVQKLGLFEVQRKGIPARFWYRLNEAKLAALFENIYRTKSVN